MHNQLTHKNFRFGRKIIIVTVVLERRYISKIHFIRVFERLRKSVSERPCMIAWTLVPHVIDPRSLIYDGGSGGKQKPREFPVLRRYRFHYRLADEPKEPGSRPAGSAIHRVNDLALSSRIRRPSVASSTSLYDTYIHVSRYIMWFRRAR